MPPPHHLHHVPSPSSQSQTSPSQVAWNEIHADGAPSPRSSHAMCSIGRQRPPPARTRAITQRCNAPAAAAFTCSGAKELHASQWMAIPLCSCWTARWSRWHCCYCCCCCYCYCCCCCCCFVADSVTASLPHSTRSPAKHFAGHVSLPVAPRQALGLLTVRPRHRRR